MESNDADTPEEFRERYPDALRGKFPLLCRLREWSGHEECLAGNGTWTQAQIEKALACWLDTAQPGKLTSAAWREALAQGNCLMIFDGVDEVPETHGAHYPRRNLLAGLADALPAWIKLGNRILLTSRPYGVDDADRRRLTLPGAEIAPLPAQLQHTFIRRWYAAADPAQAQKKAAGLVAHLSELEGQRELGDIAELRANPMLLTALCVKYDEGQRLPRDIYQLYDAIVAQVLHKRYPADIERERVRIRLGAVALGMHRNDDRTTPAAEVDTEEIDRILADLDKTDRLTEDNAIGVMARREDLLANAGLMRSPGNHRAAFYHLSFQDFFAAERLRYLGADVPTLLERHAATPQWRRPLTFLFCAIADRASPTAAVRDYKLLLERCIPDALATDANPALLLADCLEVAHARGWNLDDFAKPLQDTCDYALNRLPPEPRAHLWRTRGILGLDDRPGVGVKDGLPDIAWEDAPAGEFQYGNERETATLGAFRIARYPVTNAQFQCFIDDGAYANDAWWSGLERPAPAVPRWNIPNHPRETLSWHEATAFCRWLDARLRAAGKLPADCCVRLPKEQEWERAARGSDGFEYPWGDKFESARANVDETWAEAGTHNLQQTSAVGIYPTGKSPCHALDMAGNVWEWCDDLYDTKEGADSPRVLRGGSWILSYRYCRCALRNGYSPVDRYDYFGFRVCCAPPII